MSKMTFHAVADNPLSEQLSDLGITDESVVVGNIDIFGEYNYFDTPRIELHLTLFPSMKNVQSKKVDPLIRNWVRE